MIQGEEVSVPADMAREKSHSGGSSGLWVSDWLVWRAVLSGSTVPGYLIGSSGEPFRSIQWSQGI